MEPDSVTQLLLATPNKAIKIAGRKKYDSTQMKKICNYLFYPIIKEVRCS